MDQATHSVRRIDHPSPAVPWFRCRRQLRPNDSIGHRDVGERDLGERNVELLLLGLLALTAFRATLHSRAAIGRLLLLGLLALTALQPSSVLAQSEVPLLGHFDPGSIYSDIWGYTAPDGTELAILGAINSTFYVDVTDPANPVSVAEIPGDSSAWRDFGTYGHYAYAVNEGGGGLQIVDLENPREPRLVANLDQYFTRAHNMFVDETAGMLYAVGTHHGAGTSGTVIYDLTENPESPTHVVDFNQFYIHDIYVRDGRAYAAAIYAGMLAILDVSNLPNVPVLGTVSYAGASTHNTWLTEDGRYCLTTDERVGGHIRIFDVEDPANPIEVAEWLHPVVPNSSVHNVAVKGGYAFIAWYVNGLEILDLTDPLQPARVGWYDTYPGSDGLYEGAWGVYPFAHSGNIYVSDISNGLFVLGFEGTNALLTGTVADALTGEPLSGVEVRIPFLRRTLQTNEAGEFSLRVPPGEYSLEASSFGYEPLTQSIVLEPGEDLALDLLMTSRPRGTVAGHVRENGGTIVTTARVTLLETPFAADLAADGSFTFTGVPTGTYQIVVEATGSHAFDTKVEVIEGATANVDLLLYPSLMVDDLEIERGWTVGAPEDGATDGFWEWGDPHGTEFGTVQPEDDHTPEGTQAWVTGNAGPDATVGDDDVDGGATTLTSPRYDLADADGVSLSYYRWFTNSSEAGGGIDPFVVTASNDDGTTWVELERITQSAPEWVRVAIPLDEHLSLTAQMRFRFMTTDISGGSIVEAALDDLELVAPLGRVIGRVIDEESGDPVKDLSLLFDDGGEPSTVETDAEGRFDFVTHEGSVHLSIRHFAYQDHDEELELGSFETVELPVELVRKPTTTLSGVVLVNGGGLASAIIRLLDTPLSTVTDEAGRFLFSQVPIGHYQIAAEMSEFTGEPIEVDLSEGAPGELTLELAPEFTSDQAPAHPNPFRDSTSLSYRLARPAHTRVSIYDPSGREVRRLLDADQAVGSHALVWDGRDREGRRLAQGIYFQRFEADGQVRLQRLVVLR